ncbi:SpoIID/LytB domain-containing protein [Saccharicrinis sp. FJH62]|uniref:SpoIID/LytB domain-containing protein n=1 Tax=Saccharicrinis sp. FJH62 TaxID=3344657 RepID=UPI0035D48B80
MIFESGSEPVIEVGLLLAEKIEVCLHGNYSNKEKTFTNNIEITISDKGLVVDGNFYFEPDGLNLKPENDATFTVKDVVFGIGFHWERLEDLTFKGELGFKIEDRKIRLINRVTLEDYLKSVISSEMSATASNALLKAHAVMSRSWLIAQLIQKHKPDTHIADASNEIIRWYDREDHSGFDVCADDHCQRYQGITRITNEKALKAIEETCGLVLKYEDEICDARFSKCCGGVTERFDTCWEEKNPPYLQPVFDGTGTDTGNYFDEAGAKAFILKDMDAFCNTSDTKILDQVLNDYDRETPAFFRWKEEMTALEIKRLLKKKIGIEIGDILDLIPLDRGVSGRIFRLKIVGSENEIIIGKELEIRKALSESHLLSSAFVVDKITDETRGSTLFKLHGAGWGHGVGLCQIGAAVMGEKGYSFEEILNHYFKQTSLEKIY